MRLLPRVGGRGMILLLLLLARPTDGLCFPAAAYLINVDYAMQSVHEPQEEPDLKVHS